jgi:hypothetical protein
MRTIMRKYLVLLASLLLADPAMADWTGKDASGATITFKNTGTCSSVVCVPIAQLVDGTGAAFGVTGSPVFISFGSGVTLPGFTATPTFNLGTLNGAATAAKQPALGTAGTPSTDVLSVQGVTGGTPQPISAASGAIVDGADVAQGHIADTVCAATGNVTVTGCLRQAVVALGSPGAISQTTDGTTNGVRLTSQYPSGAAAVQGSTTGTTAATATTLAATASVTNFVCQISIRANATAAATGNATLSDGTKTYNFTQWTAPAASGLGVVEEIFNPCYPASAVNTAWTLTSAAPGAGGVVSVAISGYQK